MSTSGRIVKGGAPIKDLVNLLFEVFVKPNGKPYSSADVAQVTDINGGSLANLRSKGSKNVTLGTLQALVAFFNVPLEYFTLESMDEAILYLAKLKAGEPIHELVPRESDEIVAQILIKAMTLSADARQDVLRIIEWVEYGDKARVKIERAMNKGKAVAR